MHPHRTLGRLPSSLLALALVAAVLLGSGCEPRERTLRSIHGPHETLDTLAVGSEESAPHRPAGSSTWHEEEGRRPPQGSLPHDQATTDLDGDGLPERLELQGHELRLYSKSHEVWRSDPAWDITQAILADADNDGRIEIVFVLWKPFVPWPIDRFYNTSSPIAENQDAAGLSSHLFLYHWDGERCRPAWCSSALADPIREFAIRDEDGNGKNELIVLEGIVLEGSYADPHHAPARYTTLWCWNGWGFSLVERSPQEMHVALNQQDGDKAKEER